MRAFSSAGRMSLVRRGGLVVSLPRLPPVAGRRFFWSEAASSAGQAPPPPPPPPPRGAPKKRSFWLQPVGVLAIFTATVGGYFSVTYLYDVFKRYRGMYAENKTFTELQENGMDGVQGTLMFLHTTLARAVLADPRVVEHMGSLRFQPETIKFVPVVRENRQVVTFSVYGTRRVGLVYALLDKDINSEGIIVYRPIEFTVDAWDGRVFDINCANVVVDYSVAINELKRNKARQQIATTS